MASRSSSSSSSSSLLSFSPSISPPFHNIGTAAIDNNGSRYNGKIIVVSLAMLFFVLVFILALHIYAKWFWLRSTARRRPHLQDASASHVLNRTFRQSFNSLIYAHQTPLTGLHKSTIDSLPTFTYSVRSDAASTPQRECAVCLSEFQENEKCRALPKCSHSFHVSCIDKWFSSHTTCPLCRANVDMGGDLAIELHDWTTNMGSVASTQSQSSDANAESDGHGTVTGDDDSDARPSLPSPGWTWRRSISDRFLHAPRVGVQFPTNVLFWGDHGSLNSHTNTISVPSHLHLHHGTSSPDGAITVDASPHRSSSFSALSAPSFGNCDGHQHLPLRTAPGGSQFNAFKRLLCRDKKVFPTQLQQEKETGHGPGTSGS